MDAKTDQIKREIEEARERISEKTTQIGERIRSTFDWRRQVAEHPWAAVGVVAAAGFLAGAASAKAIGGGRRAWASSGHGEAYTYDRIRSDVETQATAAAGGGEARSGARSGTTTGLFASFAAALGPQLQEIGRTLGDQLKDLSNHVIGQGKEYMKERVDQWRAGPRGGEPAYGRTTGGAP